ncbi:hypothetical protein PFISCL1PPCAC_21472, partial [Pristionchus fissidentatus]
STLSRLFTDEFLLKVLENKTFLILNLVCASVTAQCLISIFKTLSQCEIEYFRIYVPKATVTDLIDSLGLSGMGDIDMRRIDPYTGWFINGLVAIGNPTTLMKIHFDPWFLIRNQSLVPRTLTGDDVLIEMGIAPMHEYHYLSCIVVV